MKKTVLLLSSVLLVAASANAQLVNGGLENPWRSYTVSGTALEAPQGWHGLDSNVATLPSIILGGPAQKQLFKETTNMHGGAAAARLVSKNYSGPGRVLPGVLSNADISISLVPVGYTLSGGTPVTQRHASVSAWVKYTPAAATDSATIGIQAIVQGGAANGGDSVVGAGVLSFSTTANYKLVTVPIVYSATRTPTHIQIGFVSGSLTAGADGSELFVDDVVLNQPSGISQTLMNADVVKCYPNPTTGTLYIASKDAASVTWEALNATGQIVASKEFTKNTTVQLGNIPAGIYYYRVFDNSKTLVQTGKFSMQ